MKSRTWMWTILVSLFAALAMPAQARVVYTPVNVNLPTNGSYPIDLNHDGITDFTFHSQSGQAICPLAGHGPFKELTVQPESSGGIMGNNDAAALVSGVLINFRQSFNRDTALMYFVMGGVCPYSLGNWVSASQRYLGLEFQINGQPHYGWAELSTNSTTGVNTLYGFAYETIPLWGILTGQTTDSPDEPATDSGPAESKVPGPSAPVALPTSGSPQLQASRDNSQDAMAAQDNPSQDHKPKHHQYKLIDTGTFGGPNVYFNFSGSPNTLLGSNGTVVGGADTTIIDPFCFDNPDCFAMHASQWQGGALTDLGALSGGINSQAFWINEHGQIVGLSQNGVIDPLVGEPEIRAVLWKDGRIIDFGTFGGNESLSQAINDRGQVVGMAQNAVPDPFPIFPAFLFGGLQNRAFLWENGAMQDLGTLGGPDAFAQFVNERGQVAGQSYTNSTPNPVTGLPTLDPFLWEEGEMRDLGTLGGTFGFPNGFNERGQVVGQSNLAGDLTFHPFSWTRSRGMQDLGTFGGDTGLAGGLNDAGDVVGKADLPGSQTHHAFLWKNGVMKDLGTLGGTNVCSNAHGINSSGQIIGISSDCVTSYHAALWENGGPWVDLNTLVPPHPGVQLNGLDNYINDRGEILTDGTLTNGDNHAFLLIPCDEKHPGQCEDYSMIEGTDTASVPQSSVATVQPDSQSPKTVNQFRGLLNHGYRIPGQGSIPRD